MRRRQLWAIFALYALLSIAALWRYQMFPSFAPGTDAWNYIEYGQIWRLHGFFSELGNIRTYGYPLFIYLISFLTGLDRPAIALVAGATQLVLYGALVCVFANQISRAGGTVLAAAIAAGLLLNPMLIILVSDVLTEGPSLILALSALLCLFNSARASTTGTALAWAAVGGLASNFALMVRPTNLTLVIAWNVGLAVSLILPRTPAVHRGRVAASYVGTCLATAAAAWAPQFFYNLSRGHSGIFPVIAGPILEGQLKWGILFLRSASVIRSDGLPWPLFFPNPWCVDPGADYYFHLPWYTWYLTHPWNGPTTMAGHILSAFTFDYPFTYIYDQNAFYSLPTAAVTWAIAALGVLHGARLLLQCRLAQPPERAATVTAVSTLFLLGMGVLGFITVENRFAAIPLAILSVLAVHFLLTCQGKPRWVLALALLAAMLGAGFSEKQRRAAFEFPEKGLPYECVKRG
jgi:hypothetical protein